MGSCLISLLVYLRLQKERVDKTHTTRTWQDLFYNRGWGASSNGGQQRAFALRRSDTACAQFQPHMSSVSAGEKLAEPLLARHSGKSVEQAFCREHQKAIPLL